MEYRTACSAFCGGLEGLAILRHLARPVGATGKVSGQCGFRQFWQFWACAR